MVSFVVLRSVRSTVTLSSSTSVQLYVVVLFSMKAWWIRAM